MTVVQRLSPLALCLALGLAGCGGGSAPQGPVGCPSGVVSCSSAAQCPSGNSCSAAGCCQAATGCTTSASCTDPANPHCDAATNTCKPCASNTQCSGSNICVVASGHCEAPCSPSNQGSDCTGAGKAQCRSQGGISFCAQCASDAQCSGTTPACVNGACFGCNDNSTCSGATAACDTSTHRCVACLDASNNNGVNPACSGTTPACKAAQCVACNAAANDDTHGGVNGACPMATPVCTSGNACVGCVTNGQCAAASYCEPNNTCRLPALATFSASASAIQVGTSATLTVTIDRPARVDTVVTVTITSGPGALASGGTVTIATGATSGTVGYTAPATITGATAAVAFLATSGTQTLSAQLTVSALPPMLTAISAPADVQVGQSALVTVTVSPAPSGAGTVQIDLASNSASGTVSSPVLVGSTGMGTATYMAVSATAGTPVTITATQHGGAAMQTAPINNFVVTAAALTPATASVSTTGTVPMTVTINAVPPGVATAVVNLSVAGVGSVPATATVAAGQTTATFNYSAGSAVGTGTVSASASGGVTRMATITVVPRIVSLGIAPNPVIVGQPATLTVTLDVGPLATTRVYLNDYAPLFGTSFKVNAYLPTFIDIAAGVTTGTATFVECKSLSGPNSDTIALGAWIRGGNEAELSPLPAGTTPSASTQVLVCPIGASGAGAGTNNIPAGCADTSASSFSAPNLCPTWPVGTLNQPNTVGLILNTGVVYKRPTTAPPSVNLHYAASPAGCVKFQNFGTTTSVDPLDVPFALSTTAAATPTRTARTVTAFPAGTTQNPGTAATGACTITTTLSGVSGATVGMQTTATTTLNLFTPTTATPTDLQLNKLDYDQGSNDVKEYVELFNNTGATVTLTGHTYFLVLMGSPLATIGTAAYYDDRIVGKAEYTAIDLIGDCGITSVAAGGYLEVADANALTASANYTICTKALPYLLPAGATGANEAIQDAPGAVLLVKDGQIIDGLTYGTALVGATSAHVNAGAPFEYPTSGDPLDFNITDVFSASAYTLVRIGNSGNMANDWRLTFAATPGTANTVTGP